ncbi:murein peptide amidase A [Amycolatopsis acidicola]|uniref:murein peptide amidase A n=1 Tax=Amycolatopsis acidicola TaxID=2596893 RepID=UPI00140726AF|nr:murein peptide amidase A [Amycolatopsis acidicola]
MELGEIVRYLDGIPEFAQLCTVDEQNAAVDALAAEFPAARLRRIGTSRLGEPLRLLSIGAGPDHALVVGGPHPNEPIGLLTVLVLARLVAGDPRLRDGVTWDFVPCIDPDGTRMNEGWFTGPHTIRRYHEGFYRPATADQPEWTFPVTDERAWFDRMLPETQALARVIDELRPKFQYSLHNTDFGGVFFILAPEPPGTAEDLATVAAAGRVPLALGPIDTLGWESPGPGVYLMPPAESVIEASARGVGAVEARHGGSSTHYASRHGTTTLITEVPFWRVPQAADARDSGQPYDEVLQRTAGEMRADEAKLAELARWVQPELCVPSPVLRAVRDFLVYPVSMAATHDLVAKAVTGRNATVAEVFGAASVVHMLRMRAASVLRRQLALELAAGNHTPLLREGYREIDRLFGAWCESAAAEFSEEPYPLRDLVGVQVTAALAVVRRLGLV